MRKIITTIILLAAITTATAQDTIFGIEFRHYKNPVDFIFTYKGRADFVKVRKEIENGRLADFIDGKDYNSKDLKFDDVCFKLDSDDGKGQELVTMVCACTYCDKQELSMFETTFKQILTEAEKQNMKLIKIVHEDPQNPNNVFKEITYRTQHGHIMQVQVSSITVLNTTAIVLTVQIEKL